MALPHKLHTVLHPRCVSTLVLQNRQLKPCPVARRGDISETLVMRFRKKLETINSANGVDCQGLVV